MTDQVLEGLPSDPLRTAQKALKLATQFWFVLMAIGQWIFVFYVMYEYGGLALAGDWATEKNGGYHPNDYLGNLSHLLHIILAIVIIGGGPLQLIPKIRSKFPKFHRWLGRIYIPGAIISSVGGLIMVWTRELPGGLPLLLGISLDGVLIILFAVIAWRLALQGKFKEHRRWALRLFIVVSSVWFFRVGLMAWVIVAGGPVGFDPDTFMGPFTTIWSFGQYLLPLALLELYFLVNDKKSVGLKYAMAGCIALFSILMGAGIVGATVGMWFPIM